MQLLVAGNNFYDDDVRTLLEGIKHTSKRATYILMDRVHPPAQPGLILWLGKNIVTPIDRTCELGILGVFLRSMKFNYLMPLPEAYGSVFVCVLNTMHALYNCDAGIQKYNYASACASLHHLLTQSFYSSYELALH